MHHKLLSKMDSSSPQLTYLRVRLQGIPTVTPILAIRDLLKEDMDRESGDGRHMARMSSGGNARQAMYATPNAANITSLEYMIENYNRDVQGEPIRNGTQSERLSEEAQQQQDSRAYAAEGQRSGGGQGQSGIQSPSRRPSVCTDYLYKGCNRSECRFAHPLLSELKGLQEASKSGGSLVSESKKTTQLRKPSPIRTALKRPPTPIKQPPAKKLAFANVLSYRDQPEQEQEDNVEEEYEDYEEGGEEEYR